jgi:hypothetical protein
MKKEHHISTIGSVYDKPNISYFEQYIDYIATKHEEVPDYLIPLNPPPAPILIQDGYNASFMRHFEAATNYILYAATACTRLRVSEETARRSRLRWYSVLADLYDRYKEVVNQMPSLKDDDRRVKEASELGDGKKKDKLRRKALAKEVMAGRRINKILAALKGQWHVIELHDFITREFLINNDTDFFDKLTRGIQWPEKEFSLPYKRVPNSGSSFQFALLKDYDEMDDDDERDHDDHEEQDEDNHGKEDNEDNEGGDDDEDNEGGDDDEDNEGGDDDRDNEGGDNENEDNEGGDEKDDGDYGKEDDKMEEN